jgi:hypothetical protein
VCVCVFSRSREWRRDEGAWPLKKAFTSFLSPSFSPVGAICDDMFGSLWSLFLSCDPPHPRGPGLFIHPIQSSDSRPLPSRRGEGEGRADIRPLGTPDFLAGSSSPHHLAPVCLACPILRINTTQHPPRLNTRHVRRVAAESKSPFIALQRGGSSGTAKRIIGCPNGKTISTALEKTSR